MTAPTNQTNHAKFCREGHDLSQPGSFYEYRDGGRRCAICRKQSQVRYQQQRNENQILALVTEQAQAEARHWKHQATLLQAQINALQEEQR